MPCVLVNYELTHSGKSNTVNSVLVENILKCLNIMNIFVNILKRLAANEQTQFCISMLPV